MKTSRLLTAPAIAAAALVLLAGCAGAAAPGSAGGSPDQGGTVDPVIAAPEKVVGQGTVIQTGDEPAELCLGPVAESYPPQCSGIELDGWEWETADLEETSGDVTWGTYAVMGDWDGTMLTVSGSVPLALYDPIKQEPDPLLDPVNAGDTSEGDLAAIQTEIVDASPVPILSASPENGYLFVTVVYDDGRVQAWADEEYLPDVVVVQSALRSFD